MPIRRSWADRTLRPALALLGLAVCSACSSKEAPSAPPNLIFISIDSLRSDHLGCYGYDKPTSPFLDSLAATGVRFENAVSTTSWTLPSHASMFTGLLGPVHGLVDNGLSLGEDMVTLAELLAARGYHTAGFYGGPYLHPTFGLGQGFEVYRSCMTTTPDSKSGQDVRDSARAPDGPSHHDVTGPRTRDEVRRWAGERAQASSDAPYFLFLHLWDVHYDYDAPEEYERLFVDPNYSGPADGRLMSNEAIHRGMSRADLAHVIGLYDAEIRFTDRILEEIFDDLRDRGMLDNTVVVVTSDHGEEFFEHGMKGHNKTLFDEVLRVPLIVSWPGEIDAGRTVTDQVQIIDLLPTFAGMAGISAPLAVQGRDLAKLLAGDAMGPREALSGLFIDGQSQRALRSNRRKVLRLQDGMPSVYIDLLDNPREEPARIVTPDTQHSQSLRQQGEVDLREELRRMNEFKSLLDLRPPNSTELTDEMRASLTALGYLGKEE